MFCAVAPVQIPALINSRQKILFIRLLFDNAAKYLFYSNPYSKLFKREMQM